jgi:Zn-dependent protease
VFGGALFTGALHAPVAVFIFVVAGWTISLCLHESAHALAAYYGGDRSVVEKGYLSLDPMAYAHPALTFGLPFLYLLMGGVGLPGGCVYIERHVLKSRNWDSIVSAAGPSANLLCLIALSAPFLLGIPEHVGAPAFWSGLAFLAWLQASAVIFNLLPIPGLDGFGIVEPYLPYDVQAQARALGSMTSVILLMLVMSRSFGSVIGSASNRLAEGVGLDTDFAFAGYDLFRFWWT